MKKAAVVIIGCVIALGIAVCLNVGTLRIYQSQMSRKQESEARMRRAEEERAILLQKRSEAESAIGKEELARKQGYVRPNEEPLPLKK